MEIPFISVIVENIFSIVFFVLLAFFLIHAAVVSYHWLSYGTNRASALLGVAVYLLGGAVLLVSMSVALTAI